MEAKSYSYDGDDWGDVDDYDEYGAQASVSPPVTKPTGLRQKGQGVASPAPTGSSIRLVGSVGSQETTHTQHGLSLLADEGKKIVQQEVHWQSQTQNAPVSTNRANGSQLPATQLTYGPTLDEHLPPGHPSQSSSGAVSQEPEQPYEQPLQGLPPLMLDTGAGSYGVENIARSQPASRPPLSTQSSLLSTGQGPSTDLSHDVQQVGTSVSPVYLQDHSGGRASTALAPSYMSSSPAAEAVSATSTGGIYPPRKSSLTHSFPIDSESSAVGSQPDMQGMTQQSEPSDVTMASHQRATGQPPKPLPFVRPADIYKRIEEEREKERRSLDSDRRSMDSVGSRGPESESPRRRKGIHERPSSDGTDDSPDAESSRRATSKLEPVRERKSEYGLDIGISDNQQTGPDTEGLDKSSQCGKSDQTYAPSLSISGQPATDASVVHDPSAYTTTPTLPDLARLSGFGDGFWSSPEPTKQETPGGDNITPSPDLTADQSFLVKPSPSGLPGEAADGFRSVVDQAFELSEARSASQTPAVDEKQNHGTGAEPRRTESASTTSISPIMSRVPAPATFEERLTEDGGNVAAGEDTVEERSGQNIVASDDKHMGRSSARISLDPTDPAWSLQAPRSESASSPSRSSRYDHGRNLSVSSANRSPARSAVIEINTNLPEGEVVEVTAASPIDNGKPISEDPSRSLEPSEPSAVANADEREANLAVSRHNDAKEMRAQRPNVQTAPTLPSGSPTRLKQSPTWPSDAQTSRAGSPTKGRVRDLAEKFESQANSPVSPSSTPNRGSYSDLSKAHEDNILQRPPPPTSEASFRPALPGGWISFSSVGHVAKPSEAPQGSSQPSETHLKQGITDTSAMYTVGGHVSTDEEQSPKDVGRESFSEKSAEFVPQKVAEVADWTRPEQPSIPEHAAAMSEDLALGLDRKSDSPVTDTSIARSEDLPPALPPKDTVYREMAPESDFSHFTRPLTPRKLETSEPLCTPRHRIEVNAMTPVPSMSTDASPNDQESDKLRKEIVKSLNPPALPASPLGNHSEAQQPDFLRASVESNRLNHGRDSNILPSEYHSYWASTLEREESDPHQVLPGRQGDGESENRQVDPFTSSSRLSIPEQEGSKISTQERHTDDTSLSTNHIPSATDSAQRRASAIISVGDSPCFEGLRASGSLGPSATTGEWKLQQRDDPAGSSFGSLHSQPEDISKAGDDKHSVKEEKVMFRAEGEEGHGLSVTRPTPMVSSCDFPRGPDSVQKPLPPEQRRSSSIESNERVGNSRDGKPLASEDGRDSPNKQGIQTNSSGGLDSGSLDQLIRFTESEPAHFQLLTGSKHSSEAGPRTLEARDETNAEYLEDFAANPPEPVSKDATAPAGRQRIPTFQEITAMKTPSERINAYNSVRAHYASLDTGLAVWITSMTSRSAPHGGMTAPERPRLDTTVVPHTSSPKSSSSQPKTSNPSPAGIPASGQPYYQQYLTFSDLSPSTHTTSGSASKPLPIPGTITPQSSTPSGSRVTSGHVQAKGKELLHSAGVLGGKANVAAKGLFAKGKSKWRASGAEKGDH